MAYKVSAVPRAETEDMKTRRFTGLSNKADFQI